MYSASNFFSQFVTKRNQADQLSDPQPGKFISPPRAGYGPSAILLCDDLTLSQLQPQEDADLEPDTLCPGPDDPTDFMGRLLEVGGVVETLRTLYRSQGEDVRVSSGWHGVIVKMDGAGDLLVDFGGGRALKWIRSKHLGTLKKLEEEQLEQHCASPESNNSFQTLEPISDTCVKGPTQ